MKKNICLFTVLLLFSCEIDYDGKRRFVAETTVTDKQGNPIKNIEIEVNTGGGDPISFANTNENGHAIQLFPPINHRTIFSIIINPNGNIYQRKVISNIKQSDFEDYYLNIGNIKLFKNEDITTFTIDLNHINQNTTSLVSLEINAISSEENIDYQGDEEGGEGIYYPDTYFEILKNQNFTIFYTIRDFSVIPSTLTEHTVNISIGNEPLTYDLEY